MAIKSGHNKAVALLLLVLTNYPHLVLCLQLHLAAKGGHDEAVTLLLRNGASHTAQDINGARPLHFAARSQHARTLTALCAAGAKASSEAADGATPLHISASLGDTLGMTAMLEAHPLPAKKLCKPLRASGLSPLHLAAAENRVAAVKHLLDAGVPQNSLCALKRTPMVGRPACLSPC